MDKKNYIPTIYNIVIIVASLTVLMKLFPNVMGLMVLVLFFFYLSKVWSSR